MSIFLIEHGAHYHFVDEKIGSVFPDPACEYCLFSGQPNFILQVGKALIKKGWRFDKEEDGIGDFDFSAVYSDFLKEKEFLYPNIFKEWRSLILKIEEKQKSSQEPLEKKSPKIKPKI